MPHRIQRLKSGPDKWRKEREREREREKETGSAYQEESGGRCESARLQKRKNGCVRRRCLGSPSAGESCDRRRTQTPKNIK